LTLRTDFRKNGVGKYPTIHLNYYIYIFTVAQQLLVGQGLVGQGLVGLGLVGQGLVGQSLVGQGLVGQGLLGLGLVGQGLVGQDLFNFEASRSHSITQATIGWISLDE
jgi:hypothetical protein